MHREIVEIKLILAKALHLLGTTTHIPTEYEHVTEAFVFGIPQKINHLTDFNYVLSLASWRTSHSSNGISVDPAFAVSPAKSSLDGSDASTFRIPPLVSPIAYMFGFQFYGICITQGSWESYMRETSLVNWGDVP